MVCVDMSVYVKFTYVGRCDQSLHQEMQWHSHFCQQLLCVCVCERESI